MSCTSTTIHLHGETSEVTCQEEAGHDGWHSWQNDSGAAVVWNGVVDGRRQDYLDARKFYEIVSLLQRADGALDIWECPLCGAEWRMDPWANEDTPVPMDIVHSTNCELGKAFVMAECDGHNLAPEDPNWSNEPW